MTAAEILNRSETVLKAFALGESLSWTSMFSKSMTMPSWLDRIRSEIDAARSSLGVTSLPLPYSLNRSSLPLTPGPADLTESAAWIADLLLKNDGILTSGILENAWKEMSRRSGSLRLRMSIKQALENMNRGLSAPQSGHFTAHHFDDGALPRAVVIGALFSADPGSAAEYAELDASFTHYEDGIFTARAAAAAVSSACAGDDTAAVISHAAEQLPAGSLSERTLTRALNAAETCRSGPDLALLLASEIASPEYSYGNIAHEILANCLALIKFTSEDPANALSFSTMIPRSGAGLTALTSVFSTVLSGQFPSERFSADDSMDSLKGYFIPEMKGKKISKLSEALGKMAARQFNHGYDNER